MSESVLSVAHRPGGSNNTLIAPWQGSRSAAPRAAPRPSTRGRNVQSQPPSREGTVAPSGSAAHRGNQAPWWSPHYAVALAPRLAQQELRPSHAATPASGSPMSACRRPLALPTALSAAHYWAAASSCCSEWETLACLVAFARFARARAGAAAASAASAASAACSAPAAVSPGHA